MIFHNDRFNFSEKRVRFLERLDFVPTLSRAADVLLLISCSFLVILVAIQLWSYLASLIPQRNSRRRDGSLVQFFFLGSGQSLKNFFSLFDPDDFTRYKGDKIQIQEKIKWSDYFAIWYRNFLFLFSFSWFLFAKKSAWKRMENLGKKIRCFLEVKGRRVVQYFPVSQYLESSEINLISMV